MKKATEIKTNENIINEKSEGDFHLDENYYETLKEFKIFETEKRVAKIFGIRNKRTDDKFINIKSKSKKPFGWNFNIGVSLYSALHINSFFNGLRLIAKQLGWSSVEDRANIEELKGQLREKEESILALENANEEERTAHSELMKRFREEQEKILKLKQKDFASDVEDFKKLITKASSSAVQESELQEFLYSHPWLFGTEYINAEPQKLRGAHSKLDFYLERFNKTKDIVEIKLLSDQLINKDKSISAKVVQAVDQLIDYMESSMAAAHSTVISKEEGIQEFRPRGIVIIGSDDSGDAQEKLHKWNYQFVHISILTYKDLLERAKSILQHLKTDN